ncbi:RNA recognition motif, partial [Trifolium medium]|nr:RNA recognition motif [Trifolium medium]
EDVKVTELWFKFARHGRVGEVYVPKKLDKQGRRFGFVKFREVRDGGEMLSRMGDIWLGTYKLRVNLSRFNREDNREEVPDAIPESSRAAEARYHPGRSFK